MSTKQERIDLLVDEKRVKLHLFNPSKREIWTVVGKAKEHWIDPDSEYCSCSGYYFGMIKNKKPCYHLELVQVLNQLFLYLPSRLYVCLRLIPYVYKTG